jgi:hypothetical protein
LLSVTTRWLHRHRKLLAWTGGSLVVLLVALATTGCLVYRHLSNNIAQVNLEAYIGKQPADLHPQAENILIIGSGTALGAAAGAAGASNPSGTLMLVHIAANRQWAELMSIPPHSWVSIRACTTAGGKLPASASHTALGAACAIKALERDTGIYINHFIVMNDSGYEGMMAALGGVPAPGRHVTRAQAAAYLHGLLGPAGSSDQARATLQEAFVMSLVTRARSNLSDPLATYRFLDAFTRSLTVDSQLGGITGLYRLAQLLHGMPASKIDFFALPSYPRADLVSSVIPDGLWTPPTDSQIMLASFRNDVQVNNAVLVAAVHPGTSGALASGPSLSALSST